ncbi:adenosine deaminase [Leptolyngbya iicbica]|uniref:adenosine deaminase n=2 Tax=Cyanophyceae TaxID=3028117 RepID=A0A4Q7EGB4_9CYAN|nr:adenosine deaminase [Leptolyngbya sp. LK]RZM82375.1 adenosine deaminase [Leptolyngbya sp. LK]
MSLYAELHRHLGGSVVPRVLWRYFERNRPDVSERFEGYPDFEAFYTRPRNTLAEYLELHTLVESVQTQEALPYFVYRLIRGAYIFENLAYLELRYTPYLRTPEHLPQHERIEKMAEIIEVVGQTSQQSEYPIVTKQILCMHSKLPYEVNQAIVELAAQYSQYVCAIDLAGGDAKYGDRMDEYTTLYAHARELGVSTTGHVFETQDGCHPELLPYLMRIGHGIQIPLQRPDLLREVAARGQCLEVCPTTYLKTGTLEDLQQLKVVFDRCFEAGVDIAICTDNAGLHNVRLPFEYENLLTQDIIGFEELQACQAAAFRHAFAWPHERQPGSVIESMLRRQQLTHLMGEEIDEPAVHG